MNSEKLKILEMLEKGSINAEEAARLMECLDEAPSGQAAAAPPLSPAQQKRMQGKKLRIEVHGHTEEAENINVNVGIPLMLARFADNIIENCVPQSTLDEMKEKGFDLRQLNLGKLVDTFETLDEDIVHVDMDQDTMDMKVRVYVE